MKQLIYHGDCRNVLDLGLPAQCIFGDPPDNLGLGYAGYSDNLPLGAYIAFLSEVVTGACSISDVFWLSYYYKYAPAVYDMAKFVNRDLRHMYWRFTFGQHRESDFGNGLRPIARFSKAGWTPDTDAVRIESERQRLGDVRASPEGRVPDDCWDFPRVTGNSHERRSWHVTQHPEALMERIYKCSHCSWAIDLFGGTGTSLRVAERLGIGMLVCEQSSLYCEKMSLQTNALVTTDLEKVKDFVTLLGG